MGGGNAVSAAVDLQAEFARLKRWRAARRKAHKELHDKGLMDAAKRIDADAKGDRLVQIVGAMFARAEQFRKLEALRPLLVRLLEQRAAIEALIARGEIETGLAGELAELMQHPAVALITREFPGADVIVREAPKITFDAGAQP